MSKAFAGEAGNDDNDEMVQAPPLPPGTRNYMTPHGARRLEEERDRLMAEKSALQAGDLDADRRRRMIDRRLEFLTPRLDAAQVIDPSRQPPDQILFGATATVRNAQGSMQSWRIVGLDETDLDKGWISWMSPLARALLEKKVGDTVVFGGERLSVQKISYDE